MGHAFASRALDRGHQVTVWNRSPGRAGELVAAGATEAGRPAEAVAGAEVVLVSLADDAAVTDICLGADGALAALPEHAILADLSTVAPQTGRRLAAAGPRHFAYVLREYATHHNGHRPHRSLDQQPHAGRAPTPPHRTNIRHLRRDRLGGLIHEYLQVA